MLLLALSVAILACAPAWAKDYSGAQVLHVAKDKMDLLQKVIADQGLNVWSGNASHLDVFVPGGRSGLFKRALNRNGISYDVMIEDVEKLVQEENIPAGPVRRRNSRVNYRMNWQQFQRLSVIHDFLDELARTYPFVSTDVLGYSHERRPMKYIKISSGRPNAKAVFIDGGIHAREWASPAAVTWIIRELVENRDRLPQELREVDFYVLPVLNPDGYEYTHTDDRMWRKNRSYERNGCRGADLNRNFNFNFGGEGTSSDSCSEIYRGKSAASEPETQAMQKFLASLGGSLKAYITFHSYGQYILIPFGHKNNAFAPNFNDMKAVGDQAARAIRSKGGVSYTVGNTANTLYPAAGGSDDWVKGTMSGVKYAYCIELRDTGRGGFILPAREIIPTAQDAFEAVKVIASAAARA